MSEDKTPSEDVPSKVIQMPTERVGSQSFRETLSRERTSLKRSSQEGEHFWAATYPFFETSLCITPSRQTQMSPSDAPDESASMYRSEVDVYDSDGELINSVAASFPADEVGLVELDPFLGACKLESGLKHAHIVVRTQNPGVTHYCRMVSQDHATILGPSFSIYPVLPVFFPVTFDESRSHYVVLVNYGAEPVVVRCRLFFGSRTPEILYTIPGNGARLVGIEGEFPDCSGRAQEKSVQAYIRLTTKAEHGLGCQLLERAEGVKEKSLFYSLA